MSCTTSVDTRHLMVSWIGWWLVDDNARSIGQRLPRSSQTDVIDFGCLLVIISGITGEEDCKRSKTVKLGCSSEECQLLWIHYTKQGSLDLIFDAFFSWDNIKGLGWRRWWRVTKVQAWVISKLHSFVSWRKWGWWRNSQGASRLEYGHQVPTWEW